MDIIIIISLYCIYVTSSCRWSTRRAHLQRCQKQNRKEIHTHNNTIKFCGACIVENYFPICVNIKKKYN
jgi:hypothetical protein